MDRERWEQVRPLFLQAAELSGEARLAFLASIQDPAVRADVERLLAVDAAERIPDPTGVAADPVDPGETTTPVVTRRLGDFDLLEVIGRGGMGVVYRARQRSLDRVVAVKVLASGRDTDGRDLTRFVREARAAAKLRHPGIVGILSVDQQDGLHYFVMEYVDGDDLGVELARLRGETGFTRRTHPVLSSPGEGGYYATVARWMAEAADALQHAHDHGIVHRDIKPGNLLIDGDGRLRIVDFGIAREADLGSLTRSHELVGSPYYMSPEQVARTSHPVDHRTDVYSLGVVLYELLTLRRPFRGTTVHAVFAKIQGVEPKPILRIAPAVPRDLATIAHMAMSKSPKDRYTTTAALRDDLRRFLAHQAIVARPVGWPRRIGRLAWRHRRVLTVLLLVALTFEGALAWRRYGMRVEERQADRQVLQSFLAATEPHHRDLIRARQALERRYRDGGLDPDDRSVVRAAERRLTEILEQGRQQATRLVEDARRPLGREAESDWLLVQGLFLARDLLEVFPEDEALGKLASLDAARPRFDLRVVDTAGQALPARVLRRAIDPVAGTVGPAVEVGAAPCAAVPVPPGLQRLVVVLPNGRFREITRYFHRATQHDEFVVRVRGLADAPEGMVRFAGGTLHFPRDRVRPVDPYAGQTVDVAPFWIDEAEVSNAEYHAFLIDVDRPVSTWPRVWNGEFTAERADLPVTDVSWDDAVAYALWAGKRLPTYAEWFLAARGTTARLFPWTENNQPERRGNGFGEPLTSTDDVAATRAKYLRFAAPVRAFPEAGTPEGLLHVLGNVLEMTETPMVKVVRGRRAAFPFEHIDVGADWAAHTQSRDLTFFGFSGLDAGYSRPNRGFRCARSDAP